MIARPERTPAQKAADEVQRLRFTGPAYRAAMGAKVRAGLAARRAAGLGASR